MKEFFITYITLIFSFILPAASKAQNPTPIKGEISLSGAFALYPMAVKWAEEFKKIHPDVRIDISGGGAGKGMTDALAKVVDLGMVSREVYDVELRKGAVAIPVVKDAVIPTVNTKNPVIESLLKKGLSRENALKLWNGSYRTWGDFLGTGQNIPVHVFTRSDACGAAETWSAWFGMRQEDLEGTAVYGDPGVAATIQKDRVGIGFNNIAYVYDQQTKRPFQDIVVLPLDINGNGKCDNDEDFYTHLDSLTNAISQNRFPSPPARNLYFVSNGKPQKPEVIAFLTFVLGQGQKYAGEVGYVKLSEADLKSALNLLSK